MSNIKAVDIRALMPVGWWDALPASERRQFEDWDDRELTLGSRSYRGRQRVTVRGYTGASWHWLDRIASALNSVGEVTHAWAKDVQWEHEQGDWEPLRTNLKPPARCRSCKKEVGPRPKRSERDGTKFGFGKLWSWAYKHEPGCPVRQKIHSDKALEAQEPKLKFSAPRTLAPGVTEVKVERVLRDVSA